MKQKKAITDLTFLRLYTPRVYLVLEQHPLDCWGRLSWRLSNDRFSYVRG